MRRSHGGQGDEIGNAYGQVGKTFKVFRCIGGGAPDVLERARSRGENVDGDHYGRFEDEGGVASLHRRESDRRRYDPLLQRRSQPHLGDRPGQESRARRPGDDQTDRVGACLLHPRRDDGDDGEPDDHRRERRLLRGRNIQRRNADDDGLHGLRQPLRKRRRRRL